LENYQLAAVIYSTWTI